MTSLRKDLEGRQEQLERSHTHLVELQNKYDVCPKPEVVVKWDGEGDVEGWGDTSYITYSYPPPHHSKVWSGV